MTQDNPTSNQEIIGKLNVWIRHFGSGVGIRNESTRMRILEDLRVAVVALSPDETTRDDVRDAVRYRWMRDWYHREGKRAEIDPYGHIAVRTLPEWETLLDAAIARSSPEEPTAPITVATLHATTGMVQIGPERSPSKASAPSILARKVTVCAACLRASCWQGDFYCDQAKSAGTVEKTIRELWEGNLREDSGYWFKDTNTGEVDWDAKSKAKRAWLAENGGPEHG